MARLSPTKDIKLIRYILFPESTTVLLPRPSATVSLVTPHTPVRGAEEAPQVSGVAILGHIVLIIVTHLGHCRWRALIFLTNLVLKKTV